MKAETAITQQANLTNKKWAGKINYYPDKVLRIILHLINKYQLVFLCIRIYIRKTSWYLFIK